ncbi:MAG: hypothetical protein WBY94_19255, partial [Polyangiaceae bacterium]
TSTRSGAAPESFAVPPSTADVTLASLQPIVPRGASRGPAEIFQKLFIRPFGPRALATYVAEASAASPPVYGVSREDADRMDLLLGQIEGAERGQRLLSATAFLGLAAVYGAVGVSQIAFDRSDSATPKSSADAAGALFLGLGALSLGYSAYTFARPWAGERLASEYRGALAAGDYAHAFAVANERLDELAAVEARNRWIRGIAGSVLIVGSAAAIVGTELSSESDATRLNVRAFGGALGVIGVVGLASAFLIESPIARLTTVWRRDPSLIHIQPTVAPLQGGATFGLVGSF